MDVDQNRLRQYDLYQRYRLLAELLEGAFPAGSVSVLDVGSGPGDLCRAFLPDRFSITLCDTLTHGREDIVNLIPGEPLPFADGAHDCVVAMDVLEHVPASGRHALLGELARVASTAAVVSYPRASESVIAAEQVLAEAHRAWFNQENDFLAEHEEYGLPDEDLAARVLGAAGFYSKSVVNGPLVDWLPFTVMDLALLSCAGTEETNEAKDEFNQAVNVLTEGLQSPGEHYRTVTIAMRDKALLHQANAAVIDALRPRSVDDDYAVASRISKSLALLASGPASRGAHKLLEAKEDHIRKLECLLQEVQLRSEAAGLEARDRSAELVAAKDAHIGKLEQLFHQQVQEVAIRDAKIRQLHGKLQSGRRGSARD